ncbi:MAG: uroporphyrinogen-III C-methyltransferase [Burkholderiales bacterium]
MSGVVHLVGAGPGAPDLLTVRAARLLGEADIVLHDALVHPEVLALAARAEKVDVGKRCRGMGSSPATQQVFINKRLIDAARKHRVVVRLKGGDPMLFGRAQEEIDALAAAGIRCEVVPGVTAALAAASELGVSLTRRGAARSVAFLTPRVGEGEGSNEWIRVALAADSVALYMGAGEAAAIRDALVSAGKPASTPVVIAESVSLPQATAVAGTLGDLPRLASQRGAGPALVLIGEVFARLRHALNRDSPHFSHLRAARK